jgi:nicotinate-nucleotide adenylyltransferase
MPQKTGVIGGSFDPVHIAHLRVAEEAVEVLGLDTIVFIPAAIPPHKSHKQILAAEHRWEMLRLAVEGNPRFSVSDMEMRLPGKSYTVQTLRKLCEGGPSDRVIFFLVGLDAFLELDTWWHYRELFELAHITVLRRPGYDESGVSGFLRGKISPLYRKETGAEVYRHPSLLPVHCLSNIHLGISSTMIRQLVAHGRSVRYLVPYEVMRYIESKNLYRPDSG